jgi:hypothetical protein
MALYLGAKEVKWKGRRGKRQPVPGAVLIARRFRKFGVVPDLRSASLRLSGTMAEREATATT